MAVPSSENVGLRERFSETAATWNISLTDPELEALAPLVTTLGEWMSGIDDVPSTLAPPREATRTDHGLADRSQDPLNAIVRWCDVRVPGAAGPLQGTKVAVKDCMAVAGLPMSAGSAILQGFVPSFDATVVDRLLAAGAQIVAVTNMDDQAMAGSGDSSWYGPTLNPYDASRTSGGSSAGAGASLHYEQVDVALGTDTGGSIRVPASWCGLVGLKPTHGLVPHTGVMGQDQLIDHVGPLTRTTRAAATLMQVLAGPDGKDPRQEPMQPALDFLAAVDEAPKDLTGVRLGILQEGLGEGVGMDPAVRTAFDAAIAQLVSLGASVADVSVPQQAKASSMAFNLLAEGFAGLMKTGGNGYQWDGQYWPELAVALRKGFAERGSELSPQIKLALVVGSQTLQDGGGEGYARAANLRGWLRAGYAQAFETCDFLVCPTTPCLPLVNDPSLAIDERVLRSWGLLANTTPADVSGHPALSLPLAASGGLPVGVMFVGPHYADARLLALAQTFESQLGWADPRSSCA